MNPDPFIDNTEDGRGTSQGVPSACQTPLQELLRGVPKVQRLEIPMTDLKHGTHLIPVGVHCHAAADMIDGLQSALNRCVRALSYLRDECGSYADGAPDASLHDKMCAHVQSIAMQALDLQKPDPISEKLDALKHYIKIAMQYPRGSEMQVRAFEEIRKEIK